MPEKPPEPPLQPPCVTGNRSGRLAFGKAVGAGNGEMRDVKWLRCSRVPPPYSAPPLHAATPAIQPHPYTPAPPHPGCSLVASVLRVGGRCCPRIPFFPNQDCLTLQNFTVEKSEGVQTSSSGITCQPFFPSSGGLLSQSDFPLPLLPFVPHSRSESQGG